MDMPREPDLVGLRCLLSIRYDIVTCYNNDLIETRDLRWWTVVVVSQGGGEAEQENLVIFHQEQKTNHGAETS